MKTTDDIHLAEHRAFITVAEIAVLRMLGEWNGIATPLSRRERLVIELALLTKMVTLIARDGLKISVDHVCELLGDAWEHSPADDQHAGMT